MAVSHNQMVNHQFFFGKWVDLWRSESQKKMLPAILGFTRCQRLDPCHRMASISDHPIYLPYNAIYIYILSRTRYGLLYVLNEFIYII